MVKLLMFALVLLAIPTGCKTVNPERCCVDAADCARLGIDETMHPCAEGLACVANECVVASCSTQGCSAMAPICNTQTDVCAGCTADADCDRFADQPVCDVSTGACLGCIADGDCGASAPICDPTTNACRACTLDSECASGACGDNGACIAEASIVYLDPGGADTGTCTGAAPCRTIPFAISKTSGSRAHIVMRTGAYAMETPYAILPEQTTATSLTLHGGGSSLVAPMAESPKLDIAMPMTIRDLTLTIEFGRGVRCAISTPCTLERVKVIADTSAFEAEGDFTVRDFEVSSYPGRDGGAAATCGYPAASMKLERGSIRGFRHAIQCGFTATLEATNVLIFGTTERAIEVPQAQGSLTYVTVADSGTDQGEGPRAVQCGSTMTIRNSIIWAPGASARPPVSGCNIVSTIAGPTAIAGVSNSDPKFVNAAMKDYHLSSDSPAKDAATSGPALDFERDPRPRGERFDIGADEAP